jgi:hypothetical protein
MLRDRLHLAWGFGALLVLTRCELLRVFVAMLGLSGPRCLRIRVLARRG